MDDNEKRQLTEIRNLNVRLMSERISTIGILASITDGVYNTIMYQQCLLDRMLDEQPEPRLILVKG